MPPITKLLVANRGEIARRVFRTCRELGIATVAVFSDADADAWHTADADEAVRLPGAAPSETYLDVEAVVAAARRAGADAVHPGYGFLSENAGFARACEAAGLTWIGPPPSAIESMGSKLAAKAMMADAGVPILRGGDATGLDADGLSRLGAEIGYPLLVKASAGGGGRGMRIVDGPGRLTDAVASAGREAAAAFGDGTVFLERYVTRPRHVEVQVMADVHGTVVSLFERECSVQRRHQKVVEEAPSPAVSGTLRAQMGDAAVRAAAAVGYVGAGTVEFVLDEDGTFAFLEMNTRLQVEHPVTELITGLDLVRLQILVAQGAPLPPEACSPSIDGHAVEVRLYAEDPTQDYLPQTGRLVTFEVPRAGGVRVDTGVRSGSEVTHHYDPMLAKVVAWAPTRHEALGKLAAALAASKVHGVVTNRDLLVRTLRHPEFIDGGTDTGFLDRHDPGELGASLLNDPELAWHAVAATLALVARRRSDARTQPTIPAGWRNNPSQRQCTVWATAAGVELDVRYDLDEGLLAVAVDAVELEPTRVAVMTPTLVVLEAGGLRRPYDVVLDGEVAHVDSSVGGISLTEVPRFVDPSAVVAPGSLTAPMPSSVVRVDGEVGAAVRSGQPLVVLEAMKMEHTVFAPADGVLRSLAVRPGDQVGTGDVLAVVELEQEAADQSATNH